ncbi:nuclear transport factor 2 family protein [Staphylococcus pasteuri]|uniref:nuclear transport factor 2 family protein n=1 Tax=Staphylococcus pasteuri TaxID=45972 RepID=UPI001E5766EE|nr:nuclear transport factor 2 family protein [Staphylococcus pasteuri]MCE3022203.1 nuclear transport factor 2 family protein [Staphylococcus pasteuri]
MDRDYLSTTIQALYNDILIDLNIDKINTYFSPLYVQNTDHVTSDINEFTEHLRKLKEVVSKLTIKQFETMLIDENQNTVFLRYNVYVTKKNGNRGKIEVYAEFKFNEDGKVISCNELTMPYSEELKGIGSIK